AVDVVFDNRTVDRAFIVSLQVPKDVAKGVAARGLAKCKPNKACTVSVKVSPLERGTFDAALINALPADQLLKFDLTFFDETDRVQNPTAYLSQLPSFFLPDKPDTPTVSELDNQLAVDVSTKGSSTVEPDIGQAAKQADKTFTSAPCRLAGDPVAPALCTTK